MKEERQLDENSMFEIRKRKSTRLIEVPGMTEIVCKNLLYFPILAWNKISWQFTWLYIIISGKKTHDYDNGIIFVYLSLLLLLPIW